MKVVNLFGGPGCGKSATAAGVYSSLKVRGINCELVREYAKELLYADRIKEMMSFQEVIYAEQHARIQHLEGKVDYVITDSPILLSAVYPDINRDLYNLNLWPALHEFKTLVRAQFLYYDNINIWLERPENYETDGRLQTEKEARFVDDMIWTELEGRQITKLKTDENTVLNIITMLLAGTINK